MSSLALQLFVNLNKLIGLHADAGLGSQYAKELVDRVKQAHPELLGCTDPSNAHTSALAAFSLGLALRELRQKEGSPFAQQSLSNILKDALDRADDMLEQLRAEEVHLVLQAHEEYKTYLGAKADLITSGRQFGKARGVEDILPSATVPPLWQSTPSWRLSEHKDNLPLHASDIDVGPLSLSELSQASTGEASFYTQRTGPELSSEEEVDFPRAAEPEELRASEPAPPVKPMQPPSADPVAAIVPRLAHPVRGDRLAEQEFAQEGGLVRETVDDMLARQRVQADRRRYDIPLYAPSWHELNHQATHDRVPARGSALQDNQWGDTENSLSTYLHSESAPDTTGMPARARKPVPIALWAAPTFLAFPPLAVFYGGVLWGRREYGASAITVLLGLAGAAGMVGWWFLH